MNQKKRIFRIAIFCALGYNADDNLCARRKRDES